MTPYLDDGDVKIFVGDARDVLRELPEATVHAVLTSPPFFGLRDYGSDRQIGLEDTPEAWTENLVEVFRECRRVLRTDGSLWVEVGDSYSGGKRGLYAGDGNRAQAGLDTRPTSFPTRPVLEDVKAKDIVGAPWMLAFALRADGWWLRGVYIWEKPDAMPESTKDRCTVSHSYLLHLAKSPRYFFDLDAIREPFSDYSTGGDGGSYGAAADDVRPPTGGPRGSREYVRPRGGVAEGQVELDGSEPELQQFGPDGRRKLEHVIGDNGHENYRHRDGRNRWPVVEGRSPRSVWRISTEAASFGICPVCRRFWPAKAPATHCGGLIVAHFAVWPHELVRRIVACATSEVGVCQECGAPRVRVTERVETKAGEAYESRMERAGTSETPLDQPNRPATMWQVPRRTDLSLSQTVSTGWRPTCDHDAPTIPATVLDPFGGSGTTARQARAMGRRTILVELNPDYAEIASHRLAQQALDLLPG